MRPHLFVFALYNPFEGENKLYQVQAWSAVEALKKGIEDDENCSFYNSVEEAKDYYTNADFLLTDVVIVERS